VVTWLMHAAPLCRPSSYDSTTNLLAGLGCKILRVLITECTRTVFFSQLQAVNTGTGVTHSVDTRPSDAINLAIRSGVPIYLHKVVVQQFAKRAS
jgi:uncharacterized protein